ncbi:MAG: hypothetical protein IT244_12880 [Bacteroidia bacterium]|nr:hypothetical protein [Bacteroidia bacterium]
MKIQFSAIACSLLLLVSCAKDTKQVKRSWAAYKVTVDGVDSSAAWTKGPYIETYGENDVYSFSGDPNGKKGTGDYQWTSGVAIKRSGVDNQASMEINVLKVTGKEFEYKVQLNGKQYEFKFKKYN